MHIVCPNCTTSYAVNAAGFGEAGRNVRCARCKEVWLARPEDMAQADATAAKPGVPAMSAAASAATAPPAPEDDLSAWGVAADEMDNPTNDVPEVESPSISADWPAEPQGAGQDWVADAEHQPVSKPSRKKKRAARSKSGFSLRLPFRMPVGIRTGCIGMAAMVFALLFWRADVVRLLPQTAAFYRLVGLNVNLRALAFKDLKITTETVDGKPVLVIEGVVVGESRKPVELPRLRFIVRDGNGTEIYAWNAVLEQPVLNPGEKAWFRSRLASPPAEGRAIDVRFFNKRDIGV